MSLLLLLWEYKMEELACDRSCKMKFTLFIISYCRIKIKIIANKFDCMRLIIWSSPQEIWGIFILRGLLLSCIFFCSNWDLNQKKKKKLNKKCYIIPLPFTVGFGENWVQSVESFPISFYQYVHPLSSK